MAEIMMQIGFLQFSVDGAAYQSLSRSTEYRWSRQPRIGTNDALQFTGYGNESIEIEGIIHPHFRGGLGQIDAMRSQAAVPAPMPLITGVGQVLGLWVIESISEGQRIFAVGGRALSQEFSMKLGRYDGGLISALLF